MCGPYRGQWPSNHHNDALIVTQTVMISCDSGASVRVHSARAVTTTITSWTVMTLYFGSWASQCRTTLSDILQPVFRCGQPIVGEDLVCQSNPIRRDIQVRQFQLANEQRQLCSVLQRT